MQSGKVCCGLTSPHFQLFFWNHEQRVLCAKEEKDHPDCYQGPHHQQHAFRKSLKSKKESRQQGKEGGAMWRKNRDQFKWVVTLRASGRTQTEVCSFVSPPLSENESPRRSWTLLSTTPQHLLQEDRASSLCIHAHLHFTVLHLFAHCDSQPAGHHLHLPLQVVIHFVKL